MTGEGIKALHWEAGSLADFKRFSEGAQDDFGYSLHLVQLGKAPALTTEALGIVGPGAVDMKLRDGKAKQWLRVVYVAKFPSGVYVLHAFSKTSNETEQVDIDTAKGRYKALVARLKAQGIIK